MSPILQTMLTARHLLAAGLLLAVLVGRASASLSQAPAETRPNIIVLIADDLGWRDLGVYGNEAIRTPNLDRLARSGLLVKRAFGTTPQCSPSRISMLTGKYAHATETEDLHTPLPSGERILPSYLEARGYLTGMMAKTHIGPNGDRQFQWYSPDLPTALPAFLDSAGPRPFFLWVGFHDPHRPYEPGAVPRPHSPARVAVPPYLADTPDTRSDLALYYDEIARMDVEIGRIIGVLERRKLRDNTMVVFLSDNGAPFPREKGTLYDAGTRTPLILSWPGAIPAGAVYDGGLVSTVDLAPTILELAGATPHDSMQGRSFRAMLTDPGSYPGRTYVFSERNWHDCDEHQRAVRTAGFKLIRTDAYTDLPLCTAADISMSRSFRSLRARAKGGRLTAAQQRLFETPRARIELYDLVNDPWELRNVAGDPAYAKEMRELTRVLQEWIEQSGDFPAAYRVRDDNTDRITGVPFTTKIPPLRNADVPPPEERWGRQGPT
ncbi:MAG TPA: sulfatase [Gemmatimonadales bacterium]|nr:sulfatase [Gemmatimonadales bacterium]